MKIEDTNFLITGGNRGIGLGVAEMAARCGANIHIVSRTVDDSLDKRLLDLGAKSVKHWKGDLSTRMGVDQLTRLLCDVEVDVLFNNAGQLTGGLIEEQSEDEIYSMFQVNLLALVQLTRAVLPGMVQRGRGKIINNSSVSAYMHFPCASTYAASKAAVVAFTDCIEAELRGTGVSTLCLITPGIKTRMFDDIEKKYSKNFEIPQDFITVEEYAERIKHAIENDRRYLYPGGATAVGLWVAQHANWLFRLVTANKFNR